LFVGRFGGGGVCKGLLGPAFFGGNGDKKTVGGCGEGVELVERSDCCRDAYGLGGDTGVQGCVDGRNVRRIESMFIESFEDLGGRKAVVMVVLFWLVHPKASFTNILNCSIFLI